MVKDIFEAFIENADRINFMVLLPQAFSFMNANDVTFETATSSKIKTIKLYHKHNIATLSIGLVFAHRGKKGFGKGNEVLLHKMLKYGLKLDRVHTYVGLSLSQQEEKIMWVVEMTEFGTLNRAQQQE
jgi:hypothetical protein